MCGIFGVLAKETVDRKVFSALAARSERRGKDSSGLLHLSGDGYQVLRADYRIRRLMTEVDAGSTRFIMGHSRLITNGQADNQPVVRDGLAVIHNGIITNDAEYWSASRRQRMFAIDTEALLDVACALVEGGRPLDELYESVRSACKGSFSCALLVPRQGKLVLMSNTGSLYIGSHDGGICFASERAFLESAGCAGIRQLIGQELLEIPASESPIVVVDRKVPRPDLIPALVSRSQEEKKLLFPEPKLRRCSRCILPETMPFISFGADGVCNYCANYSSRNNPKPRAVLDALLSRYRISGDGRCIMPFSGGRDSSFALHLVTKEFDMRPVTMTYDWGMVTDLARRNINRMCGELGVENILIADDIAKKRRNIRLNLQAWLKKPDLGMINILMAGDKHFFRHIETIKRETGISLNLWGMNPLEVTHFKAGFLGFPPDFATKQVFYTGLSGQVRYQALRARAMIGNPSYINRSLWDTLSGEYFRSVKKKTDFYNLFDFWRWEESEIDGAIESYGWEKAVDTKSTWRIGDGTAAFYNYVYHTMAGFTEHDTFRSNQIREGQLTRAQALELVADENRPRYQNIKWYLDAIEMDFERVIEVINSAPRVYQELRA
jgi:glucosamine--fructose-6-phosphate aminotransferase (isomerizing)